MEHTRSVAEPGIKNRYLEVLAAWVTGEGTWQRSSNVRIPHWGNWETSLGICWWSRMLSGTKIEGKKSWSQRRKVKSYCFSWDGACSKHKIVGEKQRKGKIGIFIKSATIWELFIAGMGASALSLLLALAPAVVLLEGSCNDWSPLSQVALSFDFELHFNSRLQNLLCIFTLPREGLRRDSHPMSYCSF